MCVWACHVTQYHSNVNNKVDKVSSAQLKTLYGTIFILQQHKNSNGFMLYIIKVSQENACFEHVYGIIQTGLLIINCKWFLVEILP